MEQNCSTCRFWREVNETCSKADSTALILEGRKVLNRGTRMRTTATCYASRFSGYSEPPKIGAPDFRILLHTKPKHSCSMWKPSRKAERAEKKRLLILAPAASAWKRLREEDEELLTTIVEVQTPR